jgi:hypothetical protein
LEILFIPSTIKFEEVLGTFLLRTTYPYPLQSRAQRPFVLENHDIPGISSVFAGVWLHTAMMSRHGTLALVRKPLKTMVRCSSSTAKEMAVNIRRIMNTRLGLSITGIAGPGGATESNLLVWYMLMADEI